MTPSRKVFISHASEDKDLAQRLAADLKARGIEVWITPDSIRAGKHWPQELSKGLEECTHFILFLTQAAVESKWVNHEIGVAMDLEKKRPLRILILEAGPAAIPALWRDYQRLPFQKYAEGLSALLREITGVAPPPPPPNPFVPLAGPVEPEACFNREREVRRIFELLNSRSSVALIGETGVGKSSIIERLRAEAPQRLRERRQFIYLNLSLVRNEDDFYEALCRKAGVPTCRGFALDEALRDKRLVLCLDEVEKMTWEGFTRHVRAELRGLAEGRDAPLRLVVAGRTPLDRLFPDSEGNTSPFYGICNQVDVRPFDEGTVHAFIATRLEGTGITFPPAEIERILAETGGHPQKLMRACHDLYNHLAGFDL